MTQPTDIVERLELFEVSDALGDDDFSVCIEAAIRAIDPTTVEAQK